MSSLCVTETGFSYSIDRQAFRIVRAVLESPPLCGAVAQLGERRVRNAKVEGSIPFRSTIFPVRAGVDDHPGVPP